MNKFPLPAPIVTAGLSGSLAVAAGFIGYFEGRNLFAYLDPVGIPTICEGITRGVTLGEKRTPEQCDAALTIEVRRAANAVARHVTVPLSETRYTALISFVYNVGEGNFARSTLLRKLNSGDGVGACNEMTKWVYAGGRKLKGLVKRRQTEFELCVQ